ncbi:unnamed protein product [Closterium sp. Naga37s-1]|nr:unnamed protein product [Closterium sp. Naga37s-1]
MAQSPARGPVASVVVPIPQAQVPAQVPGQLSIQLPGQGHVQPHSQQQQQPQTAGALPLLAEVVAQTVLRSVLLSTLSVNPSSPLSTPLSHTSTPSRSGGSDPPQERAALPAEVVAQTLLRSVRVTGIVDGHFEFGYHACVKIGGHIFKGVLYNAGIDPNPSQPLPGGLLLGTVAPSTPQRAAAPTPSLATPLSIPPVSASAAAAAAAATSGTLPLSAAASPSLVAKTGSPLQVPRLGSTLLVPSVEIPSTYLASVLGAAGSKQKQQQPQQLQQQQQQQQQQEQRNAVFVTPRSGSSGCIVGERIRGGGQAVGGESGGKRQASPLPLPPPTHLLPFHALTTPHWSIIPSSPLPQVAAAAASLEGEFAEVDRLVAVNLKRVLDAFASARVGRHHFSGTTGYGHGDAGGREALDSAFAQIVGAEAACVRAQFFSGTHAIAAALYAVLRPGDELLSVAGAPYDTMEEVIGLRGTPGHGSLREFGVSYRQIELTPEGGLDWDALSMPGAVEQRTRCVLVQRSCGYSLRETLTVEQIGRIVEIVKAQNPSCVVVVDNCYGEFVEEREPTHVGADLIAGSLIKNPGGTIAPSGGYVAGRADLVEAAAARLAAPGISSGAGATSGEVMRLMFQGLFLGPQMTGEAIKGSLLVAEVMANEGFAVHPQPRARRKDIIQAVILSSPACLLAFCQAVQRRCPVGAYIKPTAGVTAGYESEVSAQPGVTAGYESEVSAQPGVTAGYESEVSAQPGVTAGYESEVSAQPGVTAGYELEVSATNAAMLFVALHTKSC